jgi:hypothetical protein
VREYPFELALCARLEADREAVVARQLGGGVESPGGRVLDAVVVEPGPEFDERAAIAPGRIPLPAVESDVGPGRWRRPERAIDAAPERARRIAEWAADVGYFEREYRGGRLHVRAVARYPDWFGGIVAVENKPDLGDPGALDRQLRTDASLGLVDRVVLATASHVTGAHLNRLPEAVGVWRFRPDEGAGHPDDGDTVPGIEVVREATPLETDAPGVELLERRPGRTEVATVTAAEKARARRRIAERAYGKGWRPPEFPPCARAREGRLAGGGAVPYCRFEGRTVDPGADCGPDCPGYDPDDPPEVDPDAERARRTPWVADPDGRRRRQSGLDRFG